MNNVDTVACYVDLSLFFYPEYRKEIIKTLLALLKVRNTHGAKAESNSIINLLEGRLTNQGRAEGNVKSVGLSTLKKAISLFEAVTPEEADSIKVRLQELLPKKQSGTLEQYLVKELEFESTEIFDPDQVTLDRYKQLRAFLTMISSEHEESFELLAEEEFTDAEILQLIQDYYTQKGYEILRSSKNATLVLRGQRVLSINFSNFSDKILVSVHPIILPE